MILSLGCRPTAAIALLLCAASCERSTPAEPAAHSGAIVGQLRSSHKKDCVVAVLAGVELRVSDAEAIALHSRPGPTGEQAKRLLIDAALAAIAEDPGRVHAQPSAAVLLDSYRTLISRFELDVPGTQRLRRRLAEIAESHSLQPGPCGPA